MPLDTPDLTEMTTASPVTATFDFEDIINGLGYVLFFGMDTLDSTGASHIISDTTDIIGQNGRVDLDEINQLFTQTAFNNPRTIKGKARFNLVMAAETPANANAKTFNIVITVKKNGVSIGSTQSADTTTTLNNTPTSFFMSMEVDITETAFATGDILSVDYAMTMTSGGFDSFFLYIDQTNSSVTGSGSQPAIDSSVTPTTLKMAIPFKNDL